jgi:hypothetical protein
MKSIKKSEVLANELYSIELGQYAYPDSNSAIMRVPGGWVYGDMHGCCFIPFNNEFMEVNP